ncbi:MAG TPA: glucose 1-dehydrogenase [Jatrophihabitantaceae bacterium]|jgi:threonine dehydrogenase-like Zn-dependent dehydrogenase|nr:glucose 1-dehydrogenase [Jatrophihabitantaceae bacterium]
MRALTVEPGNKDSVRLRDIPEPPAEDGAVLVEGLAIGLCGTDSEIISAQYGEAPPGSDYLVLGHENLGRVLEAPAGSGFAAGDLVVGFVRRPDPVPCEACAAGEWDMCKNGRYVEHGISGLHGFGRERWRAQPDAIVKLDPRIGDLGVLLEPTTIVAKAWEQVERIGPRAFWKPQVAAITGAGPVGQLAAMIAVQHGYATHVFDQVTDGPKPQLVSDLGATYHSESLPDSKLRPDITIECTGVSSAVLDAIGQSATDGIVCLTGVSNVGHNQAVDVGAMNRNTVLHNGVIFGTVNANRRHYDLGIAALADADPSWLARLITRRVPLADYADAFARRPDDVKVVLDLQA